MLTLREGVYQGFWYPHWRPGGGGGGVIKHILFHFRCFGMSLTLLDTKGFGTHTGDRAGGGINVNYFILGVFECS